MRTIQEHYRAAGRDPTDVELETLAQTWSEHCSHKTLKGRVEFRDETGVRSYDNLLKETIFAATQEVRRRLGADDWCVSVFEDNAGVVRFDDKYHVCFKVETHNHPSAIEPYGGANTGLGGVIRDPMGTGLGAKPVCNTDVFCFAPPDTPPEALPAGVLHPLKVMKGVVAGVRDYGNRMGIPTVNGAVCFDARYLGNPLVFCGTVGLIPVDRCEKAARPGDLIVALGGRTGRDGIHGATFSSAELTEESETVSGGAVQIGNAIAEKKLLDVLLQARDAGLYNAVTDCGAGGFSSAVGEMGEALGATVELDKAPLKYAGLVVHGDLDFGVAGADGLGRAAGELARGCGCFAQARTWRPRPSAGSRRRADCGSRMRETRSRTSTCASCTTAGRRWCARRRGEPGA